MRIQLELRVPGRVDLSRDGKHITVDVLVRWCPNPHCRSVDPLPPGKTYCNATCRAAWHNYLRKVRGAR